MFHIFQKTFSLAHDLTPSRRLPTPQMTTKRDLVITVKICKVNVYSCKLWLFIFVFMDDMGPGKTFSDPDFAYCDNFV